MPTFRLSKIGGGRGADVGGMAEAVARVSCGATCVRGARVLFFVKVWAVLG
ncbi:hypothetical protein ES332_A12G024400v1 [Gossypium tomentosum]|uniref:Uncharacterized protein n=1 Tax=Gossypium tomentosum TaxID=34277 RepID=A0A5D2MST2_GOSTO|nr:hypothetical protein ES332_A12G024400v1 [Gossypium tomentosum]